MGRQGEGSEAWEEGKAVNRWGEREEGKGLGQNEASKGKGGKEKVANVREVQMGRVRGGVGAGAVRCVTRREREGWAGPPRSSSRPLS